MPQDGVSFSFFFWTSMTITEVEAVKLGYLERCTQHLPQLAMISYHMASPHDYLGENRKCL
jgi:hypothetical protein